MSGDQHSFSDEGAPEQKVPAFNLPGIVVALGASWLIVQGLFDFVLPTDFSNRLVLWFSFIPVIYELETSQLPHWGMWFWSPVSHAFLHGDWTHVISNTLFFAIFASVVARRLGTARFALFFMAGAAAGAFALWAVEPTSPIPMIGASGAVSACLGASVRFAFQRGAFGGEAHLKPRMGILEALTSRRTVPFLATWLALSLLFDTGLVPIHGVQSIAWQAHLGGMAFGFFTFGLFDPMRRPASTSG